MVDVDPAPARPSRPRQGPGAAEITPSGGVVGSVLLGMVDPPSMGADPPTGRQPPIRDHPVRAVARPPRME
jgi:hypothetical protein